MLGYSSLQGILFLRCFQKPLKTETGEGQGFISVLIFCLLLSLVCCVSWEVLIINQHLCLCAAKQARQVSPEACVGMGHSWALFLAGSADTNFPG